MYRRNPPSSREQNQSESELRKLQDPRGDQLKRQQLAGCVQTHITLIATVVVIKACYNNSMLR